MVLYLVVTNDKYELPIIVEENLSELAKKIGKSRQYISNSMSKKTKVKVNGFGKVGLIRIYVD